MPEGVYSIRLLVNGNPLASNQYRNVSYMKFQVLTSNTPIISSIGTRDGAGTAGQLMTIVGGFMTDCYSQDTSACLNQNSPMIAR